VTQGSRLARSCATCEIASSRAVRSRCVPGQINNRPRIVVNVYEKRLARESDSTRKFWATGRPTVPEERDNGDTSLDAKEMFACNRGLVLRPQLRRRHHGGRPVHHAGRLRNYRAEATSTLSCDGCAISTVACFSTKQ
jgi:hypothetical protein